jgi:hypothetical protein
MNGPPVGWLMNKKFRRGGLAEFSAIAEVSAARARSAQRPISSSIENRPERW